MQLQLLVDLIRRTPKLLDRFKCEFKMKTTKEEKIEARSLVRSTFGVEGRVRASGWD
jgi:hypothetical protein